MIYGLISWYKKECKILFIALTIGTLSTCILSTKAYSDNMSSGISSQVLRFHIRANSDSSADQQLKIQVKDGLLEYFKPQLTACSNLSETIQLIETNLEVIEVVAEDIIKQNGYDYTVDAYITTDYFPTKKYGDITLPAGYYKTLRIDIGSGQGSNWWCVLYPPLCYVDATTQEVPEDTKQELEAILTDEEYDLLCVNTEDSTMPIEVKFKTVEVWQNVEHNHEERKN